MNYYYITGTSRGIGKAMAEFLLRDPQNVVIGLSRTNSLSHPNFTFHKLDLCDLDAVRKFSFAYHPDAKKIWLINNAGALSQIKPVGKLNAEKIIRDYHLNLVAPSLLMNTFIDTFKGQACDRLILNISSGAGKNPIDGWSTYCASKAGLDLFSRVVDQEQKTTSKNDIRIFSIAPGVVDTQMQVDIRSAASADFSRLNDFHTYKNDNILADPHLIAEKYFSILAKLENPETIVFSVKDHS